MAPRIKRKKKMTTWNIAKPVGTEVRLETLFEFNTGESKLEMTRKVQMTNLPMYQISKIRIIS
jgi:hypothetical protein